MKKTILALSFIVLMGVISVFTYSHIEGQKELLSTDTEAMSQTIETPSIETMLTLAILDEYNASATYQAILDSYGYIKTFSNIKLAEETHIELLIPLLEKYGVEIPDRILIESIQLPVSLSEAYTTGVEAEILNIALYESYMNESLPDDIKEVFLKLIEGSEHHLSAFEKNAARY